MNVFISYRRDDSAYITDRIYDYLAPRLGRSTVFRDINSIEPGVNFEHRIRQSIAGCDAVLAVMGRRWLSLPNGSGRPRIHCADDFVRLEIESALGMNIPLIPLLVEDCRMPPGEMLPASIRSLASLNAISIRRDPDFKTDMQRLVGCLQLSENRAENAAEPANLDFGNLGL